MESVRGGDAAVRFERALQASAGAAGCTLAVAEARSRPWSSATYVGEQITVSLTVRPADAARLWLDGLPEAELPMRGHVAMPPALERVAKADDEMEVLLTTLILHDS